MPALSSETEMDPDGLQEDLAEPAPPEEPAKPAVIASITCPSCNAVLRNVQAGPHGRIRCLNCGKAFPHPDAASGPTREQIEAGDTVSQQPGAASYLLLRVLGIACFLGLGALSVFWAIMVLSNFDRWNDTDEFLLLTYMAFVPWLGWFLYYVPAAMSRLEENQIEALWRMNALTKALPRPPGSSLPYLAPPAIVGGAGACVYLSWASWRGELPGGVIGAATIALLMGGGGFLLGFIFESLRLFLWRQRQIGRKLLPFIDVTAPAKEYLPWSWTSTFIVGTPVFLGSMIVMIWADSWRWRNRSRLSTDEILLLVFLSALFLVPWALGLLVKAFDRVASAMEDAARRRSVHPGEASGIVFLAVLFPHIWCGLGAILLVFILLEEGFPNRWSEFLGVTSMCLFLFCLAQSLRAFFRRLHTWRKAHNGIWLKEAGVGGTTDMNRLCGLGRWAFLYPIAIAGVLVLLTFAVIADMSFFRWLQMLALFLLLLGSAYVVAWLGLLAREVMLANHVAQRAREWSERKEFRSPNSKAP